MNKELSVVFYIFLISCLNSRYLFAESQSELEERICQKSVNESLITDLQRLDISKANCACTAGTAYAFKDPAIETCARQLSSALRSCVASIGSAQSTQGAAAGTLSAGANRSKQSSAAGVLTNLGNADIEKNKACSSAYAKAETGCSPFIRLRSRINAHASAVRNHCLEGERIARSIKENAERIQVASTQLQASPNNIPPPAVTPTTSSSQEPGGAVGPAGAGLASLLQNGSGQSSSKTTAPASPESSTSPSSPASPSAGASSKASDVTGVADFVGKNKDNTKEVDVAPVQSAASSIAPPATGTLASVPHPEFAEISPFEQNSKLKVDTAKGLVTTESGKPLTIPTAPIKDQATETSKKVSADKNELKENSPAANTVASYTSGTGNLTKVPQNESTNASPGSVIMASANGGVDKLVASPPPPLPAPTSSQKLLSPLNTTQRTLFDAPTLAAYSKKAEPTIERRPSNEATELNTEKKADTTPSNATLFTVGSLVSVGIAAYAYKRRKGY